MVAYTIVKTKVSRPIVAKNRFWGPSGVHVKAWFYSQKSRLVVHTTYGVYRFDIFVSFLLANSKPLWVQNVALYRVQCLYRIVT